MINRIHHVRLDPLIFTQQVAGSNPAGGSSLFNDLDTTDGSTDGPCVRIVSEFSVELAAILIERTVGVVGWSRR